METIDRYRRSLKRKNFASHTVRTYMNVLAQFTRWLTIPLACVTRNEIGAYVDHLFQKRLSPKTVTCHLQTIRLLCSALHKPLNAESIVMRSPLLASPANTLLWSLFTPHKSACLQ
jgi:site-specific recombinase XerD